MTAPAPARPPEPARESPGDAGGDTSARRSVPVEIGTRRPAQPAPRRHRSRADLMRWRPFAWLVRSRLYPAVFQAVVAAVFVLVAYELLTGPDSAHDNLGTALMWVLWWPLIPIVFVLLGRVWCAVCPFGTLNDLVQKAVGVNRPVPRFLRVYGIWLIDAGFIVITWADHVWGIVASPWGSGVLLLLLTTAVVASGAFLQRRAFCRYLCPIGGMSGNYARTGMVSLRADADICATCTARAVCYNGSETAPACPLFQFPRTMDSSANCNLCAACIKNCPNDAISVTVRPPTKELWFVRRAKLEESFLAMAIMGIVLVQNVTMLGWWPDVLDAVGQVTALQGTAVPFTVAFAVAVSLPVGALVLAARTACAASGESVRQGFARFGYALIPLDIAGHIAHNLFHLLAEGKAVVFTAMPLIGQPVPDGSAALVGTPTIQLLQYGVVAVGALASLYTAYRIARARHGDDPVRLRRVLTPYAVLIVAFGAVNLWLFTMPMVHRV